MKSETPTPTRAPDNQLRKMRYLLNSTRSADLVYSISGVGVGGSYSIGEQDSCTGNVASKQKGKKPFHGGNVLAVRFI